MPFIPHTDEEIKAMLATIGAQSIDELFDEIPKDLIIKDLANIPEGVSEQEITRIMQDRAAKDIAGLCFIGAGAYEHHIPAAIFDIISRGEYLTAYTPYQAEASQGSLQLIYEYQTMMANLTGMDVSNASQYDGASALSEAVLMAIRVNRESKSKKILIPTTVHPNYRQTVKSIVNPQNIEIIEIPYQRETGRTALNSLEKYNQDDIAALVIAQPNFFGVLEEVDELTDWAKQKGIVVVACTNPISLALLKAPNQWGQSGADIVCGEGQPLGVPLSSGGPYFGFLCCKQEHVRQMPGRIVGRTVDLDGKPGFTLTLQAREQHIRRSKATSNICTNQGLLVTAATIYMSLLGAEGLKRVAAMSHNNTAELIRKLTAVEGVNQVFNEPVFHECVLTFDQPVARVLEQLADLGIQGGYALTTDYPELGEALLVCATETKSDVDLLKYQQALKQVMESGKKVKAGASTAREM
jgi:glycine dehydrogenase subunit 1